MMVEIVAGSLLLLGGVFALLAAIGLLRFPDLYTRLHAASKAGTLGAGLVLVAVAVLCGDLALALRALLGVVFIVFTASIAAHLLARSALDSGVAPAEATKREIFSGQN